VDIDPSQQLECGLVQISPGQVCLIQIYPTLYENQRRVDTKGGSVDISKKTMMSVEVERILSVLVVQCGRCCFRTA
jgi:hypothetical protein